MNKDGSDKQNVSQHIGYDGYAVWSPDGSQITLLSEREGVWGVYLMKADGSNVRLLSPLIAEPHAWAATPVLTPEVSVQSQGKFVTTWGKVKK